MVIVHVEQRSMTISHKDNNIAQRQQYRTQTTISHKDNNIAQRQQYRTQTDTERERRGWKLVLFDYAHAHMSTVFA